MSRFSNSSVAKKLSTGFGMVILLTLGLGLFGIKQFSEVQRISAHVAERSLPASVKIRDISAAVYQLRLTEIEYLLVNDAAERERLEKIITEYERNAAEALKSFQPFIENDEQKMANDGFTATWDAYLAEHAQFMSLMKEKQYDKARVQLLGGARDLFETAMQMVRNLSDTAYAAGKQAAGTTRSVYERSRILLGAGMTLVFLLAFIVAFVLQRQITRTLREVSEGMTQGAAAVNANAARLAQTSQALSSDSAAAVSSIEETAASLEELSSIVKSNADTSRETAGLSTTSLSMAEVGEKKMKDLIQAISEIQQSSGKVSEILGVIDDLAFQTNLLALNAAVEAARAGEHGRGFAVVAEAVRTLAQRSAAAAKDIGTLIRDAKTKTDRGVVLAGDGEKTLAGIFAAVKKIAELNKLTAEASEEQARGVGEIGKTITLIEQSSQGNASSSEDLSSSAQEMASQAEALNDMVQKLLIIVEGEKKNNKVAMDALPPSTRGPFVGRAC